MLVVEEERLNPAVAEQFMVELVEMEVVELVLQTKQEVKFFQEYLVFQILVVVVVEE
jgi:hypothetical protein